MTLKAFFCDYCARPGGIMVTVVDSQSVYLVSAFLAVSSQSAATSSAECNFCGHHHQACLLDTRLLLCDLVSTTPVRKPPPAHLCRFAAQRPWPVWKQFSTHHIQRVGAVMPYGWIGEGKLWSGVALEMRHRLQSCVSRMDSWAKEGQQAPRIHSCKGV